MHQRTWGLSNFDSINKTLEFRLIEQCVFKSIFLKCSEQIMLLAGNVVNTSANSPPCQF